MPLNVQYLLVCRIVCTQRVNMFAYVLLHVPSGLQSTVSDTSCPHYSWSHHQHISSLCKHNKSWGPSRVTYTASGFYSGFMKVWFWLTQKQHSGYKERHRHKDLNLFIAEMEKLNKCSCSDVKVQKLDWWIVDYVIALHLLIWGEFQFEQWCCNFSPPWRPRHVKVQDFVYDRSIICGKSWSCNFFHVHKFFIPVCCWCLQLFVSDAKQQILFPDDTKYESSLVAVETVDK